MTTIRNYLSILITWVLITLILSCNTEQNTSDLGPATHPISESTSEIDDSWPNNNKSIKIKIDSSDFMIFASKVRWQIKQERIGPFENQINKIKEAINVIVKKTDLSKLRKIEIQPINSELLLDIASVPEIQMELYQKRDTGIVNSMGVVSPNAYKAGKLKEISDLFLKYNLEPYDYYIDKCRPEKIGDSTDNGSMHCASIYFKLREMNKE